MGYIIFHRNPTGGMICPYISIYVHLFPYMFIYIYIYMSVYFHRTSSRMMIQRVKIMNQSSLKMIPHLKSGWICGTFFCMIRWKYVFISKNYDMLLFQCASLSYNNFSASNPHWNGLHFLANHKAGNTEHIQFPMWKTSIQRGCSTAKTSRKNWDGFLVLSIMAIRLLEWWFGCGGCFGCVMVPQSSSKFDLPQSWVLEGKTRCNHVQSQVLAIQSQESSWQTPGEVRYYF